MNKIAAEFDKIAELIMSEGDPGPGFVERVRDIKKDLNRLGPKKNKRLKQFGIDTIRPNTTVEELVQELEKIMVSHEIKSKRKPQPKRDTSMSWGHDLGQKKKKRFLDDKNDTIYDKIQKVTNQLKKNNIIPSSELMSFIKSQAKQNNALGIIRMFGIKVIKADDQS